MDPPRIELGTLAFRYPHKYKALPIELRVLDGSLTLPGYNYADSYLRPAKGINPDVATINKEV